ncbi:uracil phosphoribosyltransferase [Micromonospora sp. WMMD1120]|uniref:uracil phosphoribosyltransferase n=1 Tax=Micromonospora sp. WMMD1120 TaxID=3016106 RepID=UPI002417E19B|nr:uracil phosphoribosyltransferase [Micromonospora sp. WMMD1120]MDG4808858.1 uracil phosphoribosyltransferase [Micromonospora sp. WMMD1120]
MQPESYADASATPLLVIVSREADRLKRDLLARRADPLEASRLVSAMGKILLQGLQRAAQPGDVLVPIFVMRGGLLLQSAWRDVVGPGPSGVMAPIRQAHHQQPRVAYVSLPAVPGARLVLVDVIVASGRTMAACLDELRSRLPMARLRRLSVATLFLADVARRRLLSAADIDVTCIWHDERVDDGGRMVGPGFDAGDYALGGSEWPYLTWASGRSGPAPA